MKKVLFVASEALPFATSGGLGDVIGSLPAAIKDKDKEMDIRVVLPLYGTIDPTIREKFEFVSATDVTLTWRRQYCGIFTYTHNNVVFYFIDNEYYFKRPFMYGEFDDAERFAFFSESVFKLMNQVGFYPDILHAHDWQAALSVIYLSRRYALDSSFADIKSVFTIHNLQYQGIYGFEILNDVFSLGESDASTVEFNHTINLLKGAVVSANMVTTVSPTYSEEIKYPEKAHGLHTIMMENKDKLVGILNGIDRNVYNPSKDKELFVNFSYRSLDRKPAGKKALQEHLELEVSDEPLMAIISRLVDHKGLDLVTLAAEDILEDGAQLVVLGTGDRYYENYFLSLAHRYPGRVKTIIDFDKVLAKRIYAGADMFLMPSKSEPCGLAQMISSRYGAVPIVHETGGLYDSIKDIGNKGGGNGFTFATYSPWDLLQTVKRATALYKDKDEWQKLTKRVMLHDFSWRISAGHYIDLYKSL